MASAQITLKPHICYKRKPYKLTHLRVLAESDRSQLGSRGGSDGYDSIQPGTQTKANVHMYYAIRGSAKSDPSQPDFSSGVTIPNPKQGEESVYVLLHPHPLVFNR